MSQQEQQKEPRPGEWDTLPAEEIPAETEAKTAADPVESEIEKLKGELAEAQNKLIYLQADYQNYRKRVAKDVSDARIYGAANALEPFITVYDYLIMARQAAETSDKVEQIRQGLSMILDQYMKAFEESGVSRIETVGKPFDPTFQEAVSHEPSADVPEGIVLKEWSGGYRFGERLLRPAKVAVSSGPAKKPDDAAGKEA